MAPTHPIAHSPNMRSSAVLAWILALTPITALAQAVPAPSVAGPYTLLSVNTSQLMMMAIGSRTRSGDMASVTLITLLDKASPAGVGRVDMGMLVDCARRTSQRGVVAMRDLAGNLINARDSANKAWITAGAGAEDQKLMALACEGTTTGPKAPDIAAVATVWRENNAASRQ